MPISEQDNQFSLAQDVQRRRLNLSSLHEVVSRSVAIDRLNEWVGVAAERESILQDMVFGTIRWPKSLGRSLGSTLASGFSVEHWYLLMNWEDLGGTFVDISKWIRLPDAFAWDMDDDDDNWQVGFACVANRRWPNDVAVSFAEHQPWDVPVDSRFARTIRSIVPPEQFFLMGSSRFVVLETTTIVEIPIRVF